MNTVHAGLPPWIDRLRMAASRHASNARAALERSSPWILLAPACGIAFSLLCLRSPLAGMMDKQVLEVIGPGILAIALGAALVSWMRLRQPFCQWLVLLSGALFCRELHFPGTNNGIYLAVLLLLWYASRRMEALKPFSDSRPVVTCLLGALWTYFVSKTFDRGYWSFLPGWELWHDSVEETLECTAHLLVLSLVLVSDRAGTALVSGSRRADWIRRALLVLAALAVAMAAYTRYGAEPAGKQPLATGGLPVELSSLCSVHARFGDNLFLASSDEERTLTLCRLDDHGAVTAVAELELEVPDGNGGSYHLDDLEDLAWDGADTYYAISSHRHLLPEEDAARTAKSGGTECALVRFQLQHTEGGITVTQARTVTRDLLKKIRQLNVFPTVDWTRSKVFRWRRLVRSWQIDIEGLAYAHGKLLLGFSNPVEHGHAAILCYDLATDELSLAARPDLDGHGILSLHYDADADRLLLLSNDPLKHSYSDSRLWVGRPGTEPGALWQFPRRPAFVVDRATSGKRRKASGLAIHGDKLLVCFDSETAATIQAIPRTTLPF